MAKAQEPNPKLDLYRKAIAGLPGVELKGATHPYTSLNGNMFSYLHPSGRLALRLAEPDREKFLKTHKTKLFEAYGIVQKEYVTVPDGLLENTKEMQKHFASSLAYAKTLRPKPSKKKA